jgi:uncharacterized membrane protein YeaQ/YmgE (transglycosylase-associated protein family)
MITMGLHVMFAMWFVNGLLVAVLAGCIRKGERPLGERGDYAVAVIAAVLTGLADWYFVPLFGITGVLKFVVALIEPSLVALFVLWLVRKVKKPTGSE